MCARDEDKNIVPEQLANFTIEDGEWMRAVSRKAFTSRQCDQIGRFFKVLGIMVSIKSSPDTWCIFGLWWKAKLFMLNYSSYFLGNFRKNLGYFLI